MGVESSFSISSDRRPTDANAKALAATVQLRSQRDAINSEIEALQARALKLSRQISAIERTVYREHMNSTARS
jgi:hypothetical protein